jgi:hypothetical protein
MLRLTRKFLRFEPGPNWSTEVLRNALKAVPMSLEPCNLAVKWGLVKEFVCAVSTDRSSLSRTSLGYQLAMKWDRVMPSLFVGPRSITVILSLQTEDDLGDREIEWEEKSALSVSLSRSAEVWFCQRRPGPYRYQ